MFPSSEYVAGSVGYTCGEKRLSPFFGQMGTIYFFDDIFTPAMVKGFYDLGPTYSSCFLRFSLSSFLCSLFSFF